MGNSEVVAGQKSASRTSCRDLPQGGGLHLKPIPGGLYVEGVGYLGRNETPTGAFSFDDRVYVFVLVTHLDKQFVDKPFADKQFGCHLVSTDDPIQSKPYQYEGLVSAFPGPTRDYSLERGFHNVAPCVVKNAEHPGLPLPDGEGVIMFGHGFNALSRTEAIHLAWMPAIRRPRELSNSRFGPRLDQIQYYSGHPTNLWSHQAERCVALFWLRHQAAWVSAVWQAEAQRWILLYSTSNDTDAPDAPIMARIGKSLWDWSDEIELFNPRRELAYGRYMHWPCMDELTDPDRPPGETGHAYGTYLLDGFSKWDPSSQELDLYYLLSTWRPYQVQVIHSTLRLHSLTLAVKQFSPSLGPEQGTTVSFILPY
jgi:hypothetical protein